MSWLVEVTNEFEAWSAGLVAELEEEGLLPRE
jgi:hypothetical protein